MKQPPIFDRFVKNLPTLFLAILLAIAVWVLAVTSTDPMQKRNYGRAVDIEIFGLDPSYVITSEVPEQISLILTAPTSIWSSDLTATNAVRAIADLSGLGIGEHTIPIKLQIDAQPVKVESYGPDQLELVIDEIYSESFEIELFRPSSPAIGYEASSPVLSKLYATVKGPSSIVNEVAGVRAILDISQATNNIDIDLDLRPIDENGLPVSGVSTAPEKINVKMEISQRGGYRNLPVKPITIGKPKDGYNLIEINQNPYIVTVFSSNPDLVNDLPGYIETVPLDLDGAMEDIVVSLALNLPAGVTVVGDPSVEVTVSIASIQGSRTLTEMPIETVGLSEEFQAVLSPDLVDIILSGPLPTLDELEAGNVRVFIDLTDFEEGTYQVEPSYEVNIQGVLVQSVLPSTIEVQILPADGSAN